MILRCCHISGLDKLGLSLIRGIAKGYAATSRLDH